ncbi:MAG: hypothetical protein ACI4GY_04665, partial [Acutalibacteraceae bacterium]
MQGAKSCGIRPKDKAKLLRSIATVFVFINGLGVGQDRFKEKSEIRNKFKKNKMKGNGTETSKLY